jgi:hypothetical protein
MYRYLYIEKYRYISPAPEVREKYGRKWKKKSEDKKLGFDTARKGLSDININYFL